MSSSNNTEETTNRAVPFWAISYLLEGALIFFVNALTIVVFRRRRFTLKRSTYLLINLAFADILVGVGVIALGAVGIAMKTYSQKRLPEKIVAIFIFFACAASICSLAVVAVERAFAIAKPLKHRTAPTAYYYHAVRLVWITAILVSVLMVLRHFFKPQHPSYLIIAFVFSSCLLVICLSYFIIWWFTSKRSREHTQERDQQNRKLAKTLFIVTFLSLVTLIPGQVAAFLCEGNVIHVLFLVLLVEYANSFVNPFVYVLRMPEFRRELKRLCTRGRCQGQEEVIPMADVRGRAAVTLTDIHQEHHTRQTSLVHINTCTGAAGTADNLGLDL